MIERDYTETEVNEQLRDLCKERADRIRELEADRESFYMDYRIKCDKQTKRQATQLATLITELRELSDLYFEGCASDTFDDKMRELTALLDKQEKT